MFRNPRTSRGLCIAVTGRCWSTPSCLLHRRTSEAAALAGLHGRRPVRLDRHRLRRRELLKIPQGVVPLVLAAASSGHVDLDARAQILTTRPGATACPCPSFRDPARARAAPGAGHGDLPDLRSEVRPSPDAQPQAQQGAAPEERDPDGVVTGPAGQGRRPHQDRAGQRGLLEVTSSTASWRARTFQALGLCRRQA